MTPKFAADKLALGAPYWARLKTLNISTRRRSFTRSTKEISFANARSTSEMPGARKALRPRSPNVPLAGVENAAGFTHSCGVDPPLGRGGNRGTRFGLSYP